MGRIGSSPRPALWTDVFGKSGTSQLAGWHAAIENLCNIGSLLEQRWRDRSLSPPISTHRCPTRSLTLSKVADATPARYPCPALGAGQPRALGKDGRADIEDSANEVLFSASSIWEIAIKASLKRTDFRISPTVITAAAIESGFKELPVHCAAAAYVAELPAHHRDPFGPLVIGAADRAQLQTVGENLPRIWRAATTSAGDRKRILCGLFARPCR